MAAATLEKDELKPEVSIGYVLPTATHNLKEASPPALKCRAGLALAQEPAGGLIMANERVSWPIEHWPAADQAALARAKQPGNPMTPAGDAAKWRPATDKAGIGAYGRYLAYLTETDAETKAVATTAEAKAEAAAGVTAANVRLYIKRLQATCSSVTVSSYIAILCMMAQAMAPKRNWCWLETLRNNLQIMAEPSRNKRARIVPVEDLSELGLDLMAAAEAATAATGLNRHQAEDVALSIPQRGQTNPRRRGWRSQSRSSSGGTRAR